MSLRAPSVFATGDHQYPAEGTKTQQESRSSTYRLRSRLKSGIDRSRCRLRSSRIPTRRRLSSGCRPVVGARIGIAGVVSACTVGTARTASNSSIVVPAGSTRSAGVVNVTVVNVTVINIAAVVSPSGSLCIGVARIVIIGVSCAVAGARTSAAVTVAVRAGTACGVARINVS